MAREKKPVNWVQMTEGKRDWKILSFFIFYNKYYYKFVVKFDYILLYMHFNKRQNGPQKLS